NCSSHSIHRKKGSDKLLYLRRLYGSFQVYRGNKDGLRGGVGSLPKLDNSLKAMTGTSSSSPSDNSRSWLKIALTPKSERQDNSELDQPTDGQGFEPWNARSIAPFQGLHRHARRECSKARMGQNTQHTCGQEGGGSSKPEFKDHLALTNTLICTEISRLGRSASYSYWPRSVNSVLNVGRAGKGPDIYEDQRSPQSTE
ncbi:15730_t:CDS:2, partial [Funneliformis caledonium]